MSLADELRKVIESQTDPREIQQHMRDGTEGLALLIKGREQESARLRPALLAMVDAIEAMERISKAPEWKFEATSGDQLFGTYSFATISVANDALTRLHQAVEVCK